MFQHVFLSKIWRGLDISVENLESIPLQFLLSPGTECSVGLFSARLLDGLLSTGGHFLPYGASVAGSTDEKRKG